MEYAANGRPAIGTTVTVPPVTSRGTAWPTVGIVCGYGRTAIQVHFPEIASTRMYAAALVKPVTER